MKVVLKVNQKTYLKIVNNPTRYNKFLKVVILKMQCVVVIWRKQTMKTRNDGVILKNSTTESTKKKVTTKTILVVKRGSKTVKISNGFLKWINRVLTALIPSWEIISDIAQSVDKYIPTDSNKNIEGE